MPSAHLQRSEAGGCRRRVRRVANLHSPPAKTAAQSENRRTHARFPIACELVYRTLGPDKLLRAGRGISHDIGSGGVAFTADERIREGDSIELSISWPALLDNRLRLRLRAFGKVLRCGPERAACTIDKYDFHIERGAR